MQALVQRVSSAKIHIDSKVYSAINRGILAYVCFEKDDSEEVIEKFIHKIINFSFFKGDSGVMSVSLKEIKGELMIVSQFTLSAVTNKGNKPSFHKSAGTEKAKNLYDLLIKRLNEYPIHFQSGMFGSDMDIHSVNAGPVTFSFKI
ncbi:D-aminoacyl-tRNA deacylase [Gammaproteobacteria bacterium]|nr:D-aminoacyl-tRNA deacylase [Gammaproteobacteria bacterium]MDC0440329.1 D-aminoacyl-tRNA deacylase [Gammaproteobacteria bacterium]